MKSSSRRSTSEPDSDVLRIARGLAVPLAQFRFTFSRSSGPGGQNVNKLATKARLEWNVAESPSLPDDVKQRFLQRYSRRISSEGVFHLTSQRFRDQSRNVDDCLEKLRQLLAEVAAPPKPRRKTRPSRSSRERRLAEKRRKSQRKQQRQRPAGDE